MMDIDYFKILNDSHGHIAGDEVIAAVARYSAGRFAAWITLRAMVAMNSSLSWLKQRRIWR